MECCCQPAKRFARIADTRIRDRQIADVFFTDDCGDTFFNHALDKIMSINGCPAASDKNPACFYFSVRFADRGGDVGVVVRERTRSELPIPSTTPGPRRRR